MIATFRTYNGLAGDPYLLLICETEDGLREDCLWDSMSLFKHYFLRRKKQKLLRRLELKTGRKYYEK